MKYAVLVSSNYTQLITCRLAALTSYLNHQKRINKENSHCYTNLLRSTLNLFRSFLCPKEIIYI